MARQIVDFALIGVQNDEWHALLAAFPELDPLPSGRKDKHEYHVGEVTGQKGASLRTYRVVAVPTLSQGRKKALNVTRDVIARWAPRYVIVIGIAGGVDAAGVRLGDVVVADELIDYERQRVGSKQIQYRDDVYRADPRLVEAVNRIEAASFVARSKLSRPSPGATQLHVGQMLTGDKVIASARMMQKHRERHARLLGVEMEGGGVAEACAEHSNEDIIKPGWLVIRGISDLAGPRKTSEQGAGWRDYARAIAAEFTISLLKEAPVPQGHGPWRLREIEVKALLDLGFEGGAPWSNRMLENYSPRVVTRDLVRRWSELDIRSRQVVSRTLQFLPHEGLQRQISALLKQHEHELVKFELQQSMIRIKGLFDSSNATPRKL